MSVSKEEKKIPKWARKLHTRKTNNEKASK